MNCYDKLTVIVTLMLGFMVDKKIVITDTIQNQSNGFLAARARE